MTSSIKSCFLTLSASAFSNMTDYTHLAFPHEHLFSPSWWAQSASTAYRGPGYWEDKVLVLTMPKYLRWSSTLKKGNTRFCWRHSPRLFRKSLILSKIFLPFTIIFPWDGVNNPAKQQIHLTEEKWLLRGFTMPKNGSTGSRIDPSLSKSKH